MGLFRAHGLALPVFALGVEKLIPLQQHPVLLQCGSSIATAPLF